MTAPPIQYGPTFSIGMSGDSLADGCGGRGRPIWHWVDSSGDDVRLMGKGLEWSATAFVRGGADTESLLGLIALEKARASYLHLPLGPDDHGVEFHHKTTAIVPVDSKTWARTRPGAWFEPGSIIDSVVDCVSEMQAWSVRCGRTEGCATALSNYSYLVHEDVLRARRVLETDDWIVSARNDARRVLERHGVTV